jgi:hypothetical protein
MFFELNEESAQLTLESCPEEGYYIDYDGMFAKYFDSMWSGGWAKWYDFHPYAAGYTEVSMPAYDSETGYIIVYIGTQYDSLIGNGGIYVFKYEDGILTKIDTVAWWVS